MILPSGVSLLDRVFSTGLHTGSFTHVYGKAAAGKTTLALQFVRTALHLGRRTVYINSEGISPIDRMEQIMGKGFKELQDSVSILRPKSFTEQGTLIEDLDLYSHKETVLVVVDTLTRLYRLALEDRKTNYAAHRELNRQAGFLKGLARQRDIAVLVLNQVRASFDMKTGFEPVAKNILDYWADFEVRLHIGRSKGERVLERMRPEGDNEKYRLYLTDAGLSLEDDIKERKK